MMMSKIVEKMIIIAILSIFLEIISDKQVAIDPVWKLKSEQRKRTDVCNFD
jgi:hypothetical protein